MARIQETYAHLLNIRPQGILGFSVATMESHERFLPLVSGTGHLSYCARLVLSQRQSKTGMGYTENDWSLPRQYQPLIERQNIYDGTWEKTPSMGGCTFRFMQYHGGGSAATVEPLQENLAHYETRLADLLGAGVQAAWRGDRLYDTDETREAVLKWVSFYQEASRHLEQ